MANQLQLTPRTRKILENFLKIEKTMLFREGKELRSSLPQSSDIYAVASIVEDIPQQFAIGDLGMFLNVLELYEDPTLIFRDDKRVTVKSALGGSRQFIYTLAEPTVIRALGKGEIPFPKEAEARFSLEVKELIALKKNIGVAKLPHVAFIGDGEHIKVVGCDKKNPTTNNYTSILGTTESHFSFYFVDRKIAVPLDASYEITIATNGRNWITRWHSTDVDYYISPELDQ